MHRTSQEMPERSKEPGPLKTLAEDVQNYLAGLGRHLAVLVSGAAAFIIGTALAAAGVTPWWVLIAISAVMFVVAQFLAWRDMKAERDVARKERARLLSGVKYALWLQQVGVGWTQQPTGDFVAGVQLELGNAGVTPIRYEVEALDLVVGARRSEGAESFTTRGSVLMPNRVRTLSSGGVGGFAKPGPFVGLVEYAVRYSHAEPGSREFRRTHTFQVYGDEIGKSVTYRDLVQEADEEL